VRREAISVIVIILSLFYIQ